MKKYSLTYTLVISSVHSSLELNRKRIVVDENTAVDSFRKNKENDKLCLEIFTYFLENHNYEVSWNQMSNGINLFLECIKREK